MVVIRFANGSSSILCLATCTMMMRLIDLHTTQFLLHQGAEWNDCLTNVIVQKKLHGKAYFYDVAESVVLSLKLRRG